MSLIPQAEKLADLLSRNCSLVGPERPARLVRFAVLVARARSRTNLTDGIRFTFDHTPDTARALADFVEGERACCPSVFAVRPAPGGQLFLDVVEPPGGGDPRR